MEQVQDRAFWDQHIQRQKTSGLSQKKYCEQHQLKINPFRYRNKIADIEAGKLASSGSKLFIPIKQNSLIIKFKDVQLSFLFPPPPLKLKLSHDFSHIIDTPPKSSSVFKNINLIVLPHKLPEVLQNGVDRPPKGKLTTRGDLTASHPPTQKILPLPPITSPMP